MVVPLRSIKLQPNKFYKIKKTHYIVQTDSIAKKFRVVYPIGPLNGEFIHKVIYYTFEELTKLYRLFYL